MKKTLVFLLILFIFGCGGKSASRETENSSENLSGISSKDVKQTKERDETDSVVKEESNKPETGERKKTEKKIGGLNDDRTLSTEETKGKEGKITDLEDDLIDKERPKTDEKKKETPGKSTTASVSGLKAGYADDNRQFQYFTRFLEQYQRVSHIPLAIQERIVFKVLDKQSKPVFNALVSVYTDKGDFLLSGQTYSDGTFLFFPAVYKNDAQSYKAVIEYNQNQTEVKFTRNGKRKIDVTLNQERNGLKSPALDIVFIFDTTGSMGEEIERLKQTIEIINLNLTSLSSKPKVRFGMVLYRDIEEEYRTKIMPLTDNLDDFRNFLDEVEAYGGGDGPEDLQEALKDTLKNMNWDKKALKMSFIITDAPAHLDYDQEYTYKNAVLDAQKQGIKIFSVGTGGLDINGEYVLRQISQYTYSKYIFLTYGEKGESEGGSERSVSHHTGDNFQTDKLEAIIIQFAKEELSFVFDGKIETQEDFFEAVKISAEDKEETLKKIFAMAVSQLTDYSSIKIPLKTPVSILPIAVSDPNEKVNAEYFTEHLSLSFIGNDNYKIVERSDLQKVLEELQIQSSDLVDEKKAVKLGNLLGAKAIFSGKLYAAKNGYEIFLKLIRVETGEILSVTKLKIGKDLAIQ